MLPAMSSEAVAGVMAIALVATAAKGGLGSWVWLGISISELGFLSVVGVT